MPTLIMRGVPAPSAYSTSKLSRRYSKNCVAVLKPGRDGEAHVVRVERVRHHQVRRARAVRARDLGPERQLVAVVVAVVLEAAVLDHEPARVRAVAPVYQPAAPRRQLAVDRDRAREVLALLGLGHVLVVDPAPAVRGDLVPVGERGRDERGLRCSAIATPNTVSGRPRRRTRRRMRQAPTREPYS
jgi:hypothetical protein